jgi:hypothetical protein
LPGLDIVVKSGVEESEEAQIDGSSQGSRIGEPEVISWYVLGGA